MELRPNHSLYFQANTSIMAQIEVNSPNVSYEKDYITTRYRYETTAVEQDGDRVRVTPTEKEYVLRTQRRVPKTGLMLVGLGGNNGTTVVAGILANREGLTWR
eukprot:Sspe_Gene.62363::Locus_34971_Transcript_1_1_Confidence_1.000_Length_329::g.62363::m.62363/K01858/INO1, ISYNA1; myo-inositol-1-phosphate synthase